MVDSINSSRARTGIFLNQVAKDDIEGERVHLLSDLSQIHNFMNTNFDDDLPISHKDLHATNHETTVEGEKLRLVV